MNKYTILSIGPIMQTFEQADNTRALWTASFMFSYLMKETILNLEKYKVDFLVPHFNDAFDIYINEPKPRIGLFHDRLILSGDKAEVINNAYKDAVESLAVLVYELFMRTREEDFKYVQVEVKESEIKAFIKGYFQSYIACVDVEDEDNPILILSRYVDVVEYEPRIASHEDKEFLYLLFRLTNLSAFQTFAFDEEANDNQTERCFKSLPEISAWELISQDMEYWKKNYLCLTIDKLKNQANSIKDPSSEEEEILNVLQTKHYDIFKPYHKYVAIVYADGDGFGKYLEKMKKDENATIEKKIKIFSDNVFAFISHSRDAILEAGGYPVIGSGEDLLFFAPVVNGNENIFTLINQIDKVFRKYFDDPELSMSYGVSISYHKFPLQEALGIAQDALWEHAKKAQWTTINSTEPTKEKNAIHINIQKHSGQSHVLTLSKESCFYYKYYLLMLQELNADSSLQLPHTLHHSLERVAKVIDTMQVENIESFFSNMFNENIHKVKHKTALHALQGLLKILKEQDNPTAIYRIHKDKNNQPFIKKPSEVIFSLLSVIKLLRGDA